MHAIQKLNIYLLRSKHNFPFLQLDTTEASPDETYYTSPRPPASTSAGIPPNDASAAAGEVSTSKARLESYIKGALA